MKELLLLLFASLCFSLHLFAQVPDTPNFTLQDVVNTVNPTTNDLQDCINDATENYYDPTYYTAPATSLYEFRNYGSHNATTNPYYVFSSGLFISTGSSITLTYPPSVNAGDYIVVIVALNGSYDATTPTGFTMLSDYTEYGTSEGSAAVFYKVATGSESGNFNISVNTANASARVFQYRNATGITTPAVSILNGAGYNGPVTAPSLYLRSIVIFTTSENVNSTYTFSLTSPATDRGTYSINYSSGGTTWSNCDAADNSTGAYVWRNGLQTNKWTWRIQFYLTNL